MDRTYELQSHINDLDAALAEWDTRDDSRPQPEVRRAAFAAMHAIDAALATLSGLRAALAGEIRGSDDASAARADALLAKARS